MTTKLHPLHPPHPARAFSSSWRPSAQRLETLKTTLAQFPNGVPRPEYPRPRLKRGDEESWLSLNGVWEFAFDYVDYEGSTQGKNGRWEERTLSDFILVPFAPQWELSCKLEREVYEVAWYARDFEVPDAWRGEERDVLLHFGACDYKTVVWINGREAAHNQGGQVPFSLDVSPHLKDGPNRVVVCAEDRQDARQPRGKQSIKGTPKACDYWCTTGIWQSVWLESVPALRVQDVVVTPLCDNQNGQDALEVLVYLHAPSASWRVEFEVFDGLDSTVLISRNEVQISGAVAKIQIPLADCKRWSPENPHLYGIGIRLFDAHGYLCDEVKTYAGMRSVELKNGQFLLNGEPTYLKMVLDQGYWPAGGLTAPSDAALVEDIEWTKKFGFNGARKHQKLEDPRYLFHCDRLGLLVWSEMANARAWTPTAEEWFIAEWERAVRRDLSHPCIVAWVPHNESWGLPGLEQDHPAQHAFVERVVALTRRLDPTRPVVSNDGWEHADVTDIVALHDYQTGDTLRAHWARALKGEGLPERTWEKSRRLFAGGAKHRGQPVMFTEVGGFLNLPNLPKEQWDELYGLYNTARTPQELEQKYRELMEVLGEFGFVAGFCYTQLTDVEQEINGLLTYDRKPKIPPENIAAIHQQCV